MFRILKNTYLHKFIIHPLINQPHSLITESILNNKTMGNNQSQNSSKAQVQHLHPSRPTKQKKPSNPSIVKSKSSPKPTTIVPHSSRTSLIATQLPTITESNRQATLASNRQITLTQPSSTSNLPKVTRSASNTNNKVKIKSVKKLPSSSMEMSINNNNKDMYILELKNPQSIDGHNSKTNEKHQPKPGGQKLRVFIDDSVQKNKSQEQTKRESIASLEGGRPKLNTNFDNKDKNNRKDNNSEYLELLRKYHLIAK